MDHPMSRLQEYLEIVRRGVRGEKLDFDGRYFTSHGFKMAFKPAMSPIPVYLAAFGPQMSRLAGTITHGVLINIANPAEIPRIADAVRQRGREGRQDPAAIVVSCQNRC